MTAGRRGIDAVTATMNFSRAMLHSLWVPEPGGFADHDRGLVYDLKRKCHNSREMYANPERHRAITISRVIVKDVKALTDSGTSSAGASVFDLCLRHIPMEIPPPNMTNDVDSHFAPPPQFSP